MRKTLVALLALLSAFLALPTTASATVAGVCTKTTTTAAFANGPQRTSNYTNIASLCASDVAKETVTYTAVAAAGAANVTAVTITAKDAANAAVTAVQNFDLWLSDASTCAGLTASTASGAVAGTTGVDIDTYTAKKALRVQTNASGVYVLSITDTAKTTFYVCLQAPTGKAIAGVHLATGSYGP
jgi:hypothetical protein